MFLTRTEERVLCYAVCLPTGCPHWSPVDTLEKLEAHGLIEQRNDHSFKATAKGISVFSLAAAQRASARAVLYGTEAAK